MSTARNMVRVLRDGGQFASAAPTSPRTRLAVTLAVGLAFGAVAYLAAAFLVPQLPGLARAVQKPPPPVHYVKPGA